MTSSKGGRIHISKLNMLNNTLASALVPDSKCICVCAPVPVPIGVRDQLPGVLSACPSPTIVTPQTTCKATIQEINFCG